MITFSKTKFREMLRTACTRRGNGSTVEIRDGALEAGDQRRRSSVLERHVWRSRNEVGGHRARALEILHLDRVEVLFREE